MTNKLVTFPNIPESLLMEILDETKSEKMGMIQLYELARMTARDYKIPEYEAYTAYSMCYLINLEHTKRVPTFSNPSVYWDIHYD